MLGGTSIPLSVGGGRNEPDAEALVLARQIEGMAAACAGEIDDAFDEHRQAYEAPPGTSRPTPVYAAVLELDGVPTIEVGYCAPWDEEHTLGVCLRHGKLVELNGSVLEP